MSAIILVTEVREMLAKEQIYQRCAKDATMDAVKLSTFIMVA
jgi:hypothetical protein